MELSTVELTFAAVNPRHLRDSASRLSQVTICTMRFASMADSITGVFGTNGNMNGSEGQFQAAVVNCVGHV